MSYILTPLPSEFFEIWKKSSSTDGEFTYSVGLILPHKYIKVWTKSRSKKKAKLLHMLMCDKNKTALP
jgi:hypothetical protein